MSYHNNKKSDGKKKDIDLSPVTDAVKDEAKKEMKRYQEMHATS